MQDQHCFWRRFRKTKIFSNNQLVLQRAEIRENFCQSSTKDIELDFQFANNQPAKAPTPLLALKALMPSMEVQAKTHSPMPPMDRWMSFIDIQRDQKSDIKQRRKGHKNRSIAHHADIIETLDTNSQIRLIGTKMKFISAKETSKFGLNGIGIYSHGSLTALYIGGDINANELLDMTTGALNP